MWTVGFKMRSRQRLILTHLPHYGEHEVLAGQAREKYDGPVILAENIRYLDI